MFYFQMSQTMAGIWWWHQLQFIKKQKQANKKKQNVPCHFGFNESDPDSQGPMKSRTTSRGERQPSGVLNGLSAEDSASSLITALIIAGKVCLPLCNFLFVFYLPTINLALWLGIQRNDLSWLSRPQSLYWCWWDAWTHQSWWISLWLTWVFVN